jgi:hypothetical protein
VIRFMTASAAAENARRIRLSLPLARNVTTCLCAADWTLALEYGSRLFVRQRPLRSSLTKFLLKCMRQDRVSIVKNALHNGFR